MRLYGLALLVSAMAFCLAAFPLVERDAGPPVAGISAASPGHDDGATVTAAPGEVLTVRNCGGTPDLKSGWRSTHAYLNSIGHGGNMTGLAGSRAGGRGASPGIAA